MRASTKRMLSILLSGLFLIGILAVVTSLIVPEFKRVSDRRALLFSRQLTLQNQMQAVDDVQRLIQEFQGFERVRTTVSLAMPRSMDATLILWQLQAVADASGASIRSFDAAQQAFETSRAPLARRLGTLQITTVVVGTYEELEQFLRHLETNVRVFGVREFDFGPVGLTAEEGGGAAFQMSVTFDAYFQE
ncbi:hypothetical protein A2110_01685 [Candidatus Jorgensenbacteria bacterium GWA1_54_12]|uniref:Type 4a pilus biogenesis protein PilO n=1 Tax=Candidatus Jorgensenbacteria bacterium GWA1_54_12 TaxID=1798468 RepID=A0A1F6BLA0_9BACT|nr:MAG: hypothetical protein A2110_01685 [Candidatus Jorgensenbacteria bacterium GWA1_54_12]